MMLKNAEIAAHGILPFCQDTGTATIIGKKGQQVWTGCDDAEFLSKGIYQTYIHENLRYSQTAPLNMYDEVNTRTNLPAQIDLYATEGDAYKFLFVSKGGGSANKTFLYQETKALLNPDAPQGVLRGEDEVARHRRLPALSPGVRHRRHLGGELSQDRQNGLHQVLRRAAHRRQRARPGVPRSGTGKGTAATRPRGRHRRAVRRQILRARRARHPPAAPWRLLPGRHRRLLLGRPPGQGEDHQGRHLHRETRKESRPLHSGEIPRLEVQGRVHRPRPRHGGNPQDAATSIPSPPRSL